MSRASSIRARLEIPGLAMLLVALAALVAAPQAAGSAASVQAEQPEKAHEVIYDRYSLKVDGRRIFLWTGEFHYFRLPSPDLWRDVLERLKAAGFNGVSLYFNWSYHSPKPGVYDFSGVRDVDRLLRTVDEVGLYAVVRPGPYINAEVSGGGFPAWLKTVPGRGRSFEPGYREAYREWLSHINPIIARHQVTRGGAVIAYNVENEYAVNVDREYMADLQQQARDAGIDVPITHNQCCDAAPWTADWSTGLGAVQIPGVDDYPQSFNCPDPEGSWGAWGVGVTERTRDDAPVYAAEYQAGAIDLFNAGYEKCRRLTGPNFMKVFYKSNLIASGATMYGYYMAYGGTNWGWLSQPNDVYTSYDYGAAITESRQLTGKYDEFKRQGYLLASVPPLTKTDPVTAPVSDNPAVYTEARANPDTGTQFVLVRHPDRRTSTDDSATLAWTTPDGGYRVPVRVRGRDAKILVAGYDMGGQRLVWSSSEILTHAAIGGRDVAVLYGRDGEAGSTVLRYPSPPSVRVLAGSVHSSYDAASGDLRLDYTHSGLARVLVSGGGRPPLLLLVGTDETAARFWRLDTTAGPLLVNGTSLVRSGAVYGDTVWLRADTAAAGDVEVFAPAAVRRLVVGSDTGGGPGRQEGGAYAVPVRRTSSESLLGRVRGPAAVELPALTSWRYRRESATYGAAEAAPGFDDSSWTVADKTTTISPVKPKTLPVLYADEYGFHYGNVWYRGRFTATGSETSVRLNAITGKRGIYLVWLNGRYLGWAAGGTQADTDPDNPTPNPDPGRGDFAIPTGLLEPGETATLSVLVANMGHNDDWIANDTRMRQPRGLIGAAVVDADGPSVGSIAWRIQGARGGEDLVDPARGPLNVGGLFGERFGWHLPGYPDDSWQRAAAPSRAVSPGVTWFRTTFRLDLPTEHDVSVGLRFGGTGNGSEGLEGGTELPAGHRVLVFLNGWNVGQFGAEIGPQRDFVLPGGLLRQHGVNTLALAVVAKQGGISLPVELVTFGNQRGGVHVRDVHSPGYDPRTYG